MEHLLWVPDTGVSSETNRPAVGLTEITGCDGQPIKAPWSLRHQRLIHVEHTDCSENLYYYLSVLPVNNFLLSLDYLSLIVGSLTLTSYVAFEVGGTEFVASQKHHFY